MYVIYSQVDIPEEFPESYTLPCWVGFGEGERGHSGKRGTDKVEEAGSLVDTF